MDQGIVGGQGELLVAGRNWWAIWLASGLGQVVVLLVLIGIMLVIGFGLKGCVVTSEWEREQVVRCAAAGGVWSNGTDGDGIGVGCFVPVVLGE